MEAALEPLSHKVRYIRLIAGRGCAVRSLQNRLHGITGT